MAEKISRLRFLKVLAGFGMGLVASGCVHPTQSDNAKVKVALRIAFSEAMDRASVEGAARLVTSGGTVAPSSAIWLDDATVRMSFGTFARDDVAQFELADSAADLAGNTVSGFTLLFS